MPHSQEESKGSSRKACHEHQTLFKVPRLESWGGRNVVRNNPELQGRSL